MKGDFLPVWKFENRLLASLGLAESCMFIDRLALGFLAPMIASDMGLSNFQIGAISSIFSVTYAISGFLGGWAADSSGRRASHLLWLVLFFSALSATTGLAKSFAAIIAIRLLLGLVEGPVLPILQSIMIPASSPGRAGFNVGFLQNVAPFLLGQLAAPIALTQISARFGWRTAFYMTAIPGLLLLPFLRRILTGLLNHSSANARVGSTLGASAETNVFRSHNVRVCVLLAACTGTTILLQNAFLPLYLVRVKGYSAIEMGYIISVIGAVGCTASIVLPWLSDRFGRAPILRIGFLLGVVTPLGILLVPKGFWADVSVVAVGSVLLGCTPITITIIPADSVHRSILARSIGFTSASSALVGGVIMPTVGGKLADVFGLGITLEMAAAAAGIGFLGTFGLRPPPMKLPVDAT
jgi:MFS family permease